MKQIGNQNVLQSLKTLDPSLKLYDNILEGSNPNALPTIEMRGKNGISDLDASYKGNPNQPLFIMDGFETTLQQVMDLDPNRVESISILKDAQAAALYGSRSANGVIVIETIAPERGKLRFSYTGDYALSTPDLSDYNLLNSVEKLAVEKEAGHFEGRDLAEDAQLLDYYNRLNKNVKEGVNTYWLSKPLESAVEHRHAIRVEGGDDILRYNINFTARFAPGVMKGSGRDNYQGGMYLSYKKKNLLFKNDLFLSYNIANESPYGSFAKYADLNPYFKPYHESGKLTPHFMENVPNKFAEMNKNPLYDATLNTMDRHKELMFRNNFSVEWDISDKLTLMGRFSISKTMGEKDYFLPAQHSSFTGMGDPINDPENYMRRGIYEYHTNGIFSLLGDINLRYNHSIDKHSFYAVFGANVQETLSEEKGFKAEGFPNGLMDNIGAAKQYYRDGRPSSSDIVTRLAGVLATFNYAYANKYLFDATFKLDGSSNFGSNHRYAPIWSVGLGWNIHKERLFENISRISQLKLRASSGVTATQNFATHQALRKYIYNTDSQYTGIVSASMLGFGNKNLKWQETFINNVGVDFGLWDDRFTFIIDVYSRKTTNLLADVTIAPSTGFLQYRDNVGETENKGFEISTRYTIIRNPHNNIYWSVNLSAAHNENKISKISNAMKRRNEEIIANAQNNRTSAPLMLIEEGNSMSAIYAMRSLGIDPSNGKELYEKKDGTHTYTWMGNEQVVIGDENPDIEGVFGSSLTFKNFTGSVFFRYRFGGQIYNSTVLDRVENANLYKNVDKRVYDSRWQKVDDETFFKDLRSTDFTRQSSRFVMDDNSLAVESISLSYDVTNDRFLKRVGMERMRLTAYLNDIWRFSSVKQERGLNYPFARRYAFSLNITF